MGGRLKKKCKPLGADGTRTQLVLPPCPFAKSREEPCSTVHEEVQFFLCVITKQRVIKGLKSSDNSLKSSSGFEKSMFHVDPLRLLPDFLSILCDFGHIEDSALL